MAMVVGTQWQPATVFGIAILTVLSLLPGRKEKEDLPPDVLQDVTTEVQSRIFDYPIHLLCLDDLKLYTRTQLAQALARDITRDLRRRHGLDAHKFLEKDVVDRFSDLSKYAIFSHRWGPDEVTYRPNFKKALASDQPGALKIRKFCEKAREYGCRYVWFDTGCINSANSTELDESIRSMYKWYTNAHVCIVHLGQTTSHLVCDGDGVDEWFQRGWTLQELLAPQRLKFFNKDWEPLTENEYDIGRGSTSRPASLEILSNVSKITGIDEANLRAFRPHDLSVRRILTWVSKRDTSRSEDLVYCLLGLLDVTLNIAYGEGLERAFNRLQIELAKRYDDRSLFLFDGEFSARNRMLARSPKAFSTPFSGVVLPSDTLVFREGKTTPDISMTIYGLHIAIVLYAVDRYQSDSSPPFIEVKDLGRIDCSVTDTFDGKPQLFLGIIGHARSERKRFFFAVLLRRAINTPSRYQRLRTDPVVLSIGAASVISNKSQDELVLLKEPEMVFIE